MALSPSLQQFKSSGVYRLEFDKSQIINIPSETIRLIIGFSKKGPFNTPVFVQDSVFFRSVFGEIDTTLERKGSFFHRTVLTCLERGPVIVLNLLNLESVDTSQFKSISTSTSQANSATVTAPVSSFFNQDKFWYTDPNALVDYANNGTSQSINAQRLLNVANIGRKTISVIAKKSDALGFNILAKEWFSVGQIPEYMNENDYIIDYMVDLIIVEGDFSDYTALSIDPVFGTYFDTTGLKKNYTDQYGFVRNGLTDFLNLNTVNVLGVYTGALLPEFQDKNGENLYIQDLVNLETSRTGLLLGFNNDKMDDDPEEISGDLIDLVGHTLESEAPAVLDFLSYYGPIIDTFTYAGSTGVDSIIIAATAGQTGANALVVASTVLQGGSATNGWTSTAGHYDTLYVYGPSATLPSLFTSAFATPAAFSTFRSEIAPSQTFFKVGQSGGTSYANFVKVEDESYNSTTDILTLQISLVADAGVTGPTDSNYAYYFLEGGTGITGGGTAALPYFKSLNQTFGDGTNLYTLDGSELYLDNLNGDITDGDSIGLTGGTTPTAYGYAEFIRYAETNFDTTPIGTTANAASAFGAELPIFASEINYLVVNAYENEGLTGATSIDIQPDYAINTLTGSINESLEVDATFTPTNPTTVVWLDNTSTGPFGQGGYTGKIVSGDYLVMNFGGTSAPTNISPITAKSRLTRVILVQEIVDPTSAYYGYIKVTTNDPIFIKDNGVTLEVERYKSVENFVEHYHIHKLSGYTLRPEQMPDGTLTRQNEILDVMYDTNIASALEDREVITFRYIVDSFEGGIEPASKIRLSRLAKSQQSSLAICNMPAVKQFRESTNPLFKFDATSSFDATYIATGGNLSLNPSNVFSLPGIADGANYSAFYGPNLTIREGGRNISVPPAAYVSNLFIDKYNLALPYSIVAGPRRGVLSAQGLVGTEYAFDRTDLDSIEPFGYNAILNKRGFGLVINANQTAQQTVKSALSQIHVRELLIYIQDGIEAILNNYRWEFNTAQNRLEIKTLADNFLSQILADGGVYDYQNIMDTSNNTPEVIDSNIGILDTYIEPVRGMGILVHRTTILKTGTIATGNFI
jgi:hypothetical protein